MAKPNQPRDIKPQNGEDKQTAQPVNSSLGRIIAINIITTILICIIIFVVNFLTVQKFTSKLDAISSSSASEDEVEGLGEEIERGLIVDMGEFTMNLADASPRRYLKVNVALEVSKTEADRAALKASKTEASGHGGGHGHGSAPAVDPLKSIEEEMAQYKPAIRDAVITTLSSKTSNELATVPGKELAKEQIAEAVDAIFNGEREVMRVSFGQFIMQ